MSRFFSLALLLVIPFAGMCQENVAVDSVRQASDTIFIKKGGKVYTGTAYANRFQPRKALMYSAILPGAGQVYNKKYWKLPLIYGGLVFVTSIAITYNDYYNKYKNELYGLLETPSIPPPSGYSETQLRTLIDTYRRQRDFFLILDGIIYILQIVDAHVDAHLKEFDLNPNLKVRLEPTSQPSIAMGSIPGLSLTLKF